MIQALKALQDKLRALELERLVAADKFRHVELETERYSRGATVDSGVLMDTPFQTASVRTTPQTLSAPFSPTADGEELQYMYMPQFSLLTFTGGLAHCIIFARYSDSLV